MSRTMYILLLLAASLVSFGQEEIGQTSEYLKYAYRGSITGTTKLKDGKTGMLTKNYYGTGMLTINKKGICDFTMLKVLNRNLLNELRKYYDTYAKVIKSGYKWEKDWVTIEYKVDQGEDFIITY